MPFVNLHVHTEYSLLDGMCKVKDLVKRVKNIGQTSIAMTDHGNMHGLVKFYKECIANEVKPIVGCEIYVVNDKLAKDPKNRKASHLVLLAKNQEGLSNLMKIASDASIEGFYYSPRTDPATLAKYSKGIIALSACQSGEVAKCLLDEEEDRTSEAMDVARFYDDIFDEFYLEIQASITEKQDRLNEKIVNLAKVMNLPLVATNDCHYISREDADYHDTFLAIQSSASKSSDDRMKQDSDVYWVKSEDETRSMLMSRENISPDDIDEAIQNTFDIAEKCNVTITLGETYYPDFEVPDGHTLDTFIKQQSDYGLFQYALDNPGIDLDVYRERIEYELNVIREAGLSGYLLTVQDFIQYSREKRIPVGPGRGSAAGSLVVFCLGITQVDPIKEGLMFER